MGVRRRRQSKLSRAATVRSMLSPRAFVSETARFKRAGGSYIRSGSLRGFGYFGLLIRFRSPFFLVQLLQLQSEDMRALSSFISPASCTLALR